MHVDVCDVIDHFFHPQFTRLVAGLPAKATPGPGPRAPARGGPTAAPAQPNPFSKLVSRACIKRHPTRADTSLPGSNNSLATYPLSRRRHCPQGSWQENGDEPKLGSAQQQRGARGAMLGRAARGGPSSTTATKPPPHAEGAAVATAVVADYGQEVTVSQFVAQLGSYTYTTRSRIRDHIPLFYL